jgi:methylthioribose-1-phosphate isomerase
MESGSKKVLDKALALAEEDANSCREMGRIGADFLVKQLGEKKLRILTHCNTGALATTEWGTALGVVRELHSRGLIEEVFADETRPLLQGSRLTAWELAQAGIPYRILPDGAAASALFSGLIDAVLIGADRIAKNGDSANKIGSLSVAVAANQVAVPFLVVAPESTVDRNIESGAEIEIEFRSDSEVTSFAGVNTAPLGSKTYNPAFDVTPARFITAVITDKRVYRVKDGEAL